MRFSDSKFFSGHKDLLRAVKLGIMASRNIFPGLTQYVIESVQKLSKSKAIFIGGWHSAIEKEIHALIVKGQKPHIHVGAKTVEKMSCKLNKKQTLFISHCHPGIIRITRENALKRNRIVCELSNVLLIPWLDPIGKTHQIVLDFCKDLSVFVFNKEFNSDLIQGGARPYNYFEIVSILEENYADN
jgi:hypothetical protein